ncbi:MAG: glycosyltransferase [Actinomycetota bacterium]|nr:glycosyltransferase [Actinomycetota bacterium]
MRIVQLANFYSETSGGLRTALHSLAAEYTAAGHEVVRIVPGARPGERQLGSARHIEVAGMRLGSTGYRVVTDHAALGRLLAQLAPDVIELSDKTTMVGPAGRMRAQHGMPVVLLSHERIDAILRGKVPRGVPLTRLADTWNRRLARQCDAVVCASTFAAVEWVRVRAPRVERIALGVDLSVFAPDPAAHAGTSSALQLVCVGRLSSEKNPALAIETVRALVARRVHCELHMVGDGPLASTLRADAGDLPVRFHGHVGDRAQVAALLRRADVALAPCTVETFGLSALEAMACGTPVVVSPKGALGELIAAGTGAIADATPNAFAAAVVDVARCDRRIATIFTRAHAERFPWSATGKRMLQLMGRLIDERSARSLHPSAPQALHLRG